MSKKKIKIVGTDNNSSDNTPIDMKKYFSLFTLITYAP